MADITPPPLDSATPDGLRTEWQQDRWLYKAALKFVMEFGEEGIKTLVPGGDLLVRLVKSTLDFSDAADEATFEARMSELVLIGSKTRDDIKGVAALAELMRCRQDEILARLDRMSPPLNAPELDELAAQTALRAHFEALALWRKTITVWCETAISTSHGDASTDQILATLRLGRGMILEGEPGVGKTVLSHNLASRLSCEGIPFVEVEAKYFAGDLELMIDRFLRSIGSPGQDSLFKSCHAKGLRVILLIDGMNECPREHLRKLGQEIDFLVNTRRGVPLLSSQISCDTILTTLEVYELSIPSIDEKRSIASSHGRLSREADGLLTLARTGLEASIVGKIATQAPEPKSRAELFSRYVNERLGEDAIGIDARDVLRCLASAIHERLALVAPRAELQRMVLSRSRPGDIQARIASSGLLTESFESISFSHELWRDFFAGEALALVQSDPRAFAAELSREVNAELAPFALGFATELQARNAVAGLGTASLLDCILGRSGPAAAGAARVRCERALTHLESVIATFDIDWSPRSGDWRGCFLVPDDTAPFDLPALRAVGYQLARSKSGILRMLEIIERVDQHIEVLRRQRRMAGSTLPRSVSFAQVYLGFAAPAPLQALLNFVDNIQLPAKLSRLPLADYTLQEEVCVEVMNLLQNNGLTLGQYYFVIRLSNVSRWGGIDFARGAPSDIDHEILSLVKRLWSEAPYHLQIELLEAFKGVIFRRRGDNEMRRVAQDFCEKILSSTDNPFLNVEVWEILDDLKDRGNEIDLERVELKILEILSSEPSPDVYRAAYQAWIQQMDGPYQRAYGDAIYSLPRKQRGRLEELAFMSLQEPALFDLILVEQAVAKPRPEFEPVFRRLAVPPVKAVFRQDATRAFLLAAVGLRRLDAEVPIADAPAKEVAAWWALAEIFCEMFSFGAPNQGRIHQAWSRLCEPLIDDAIEPIGDILSASAVDRESGVLQVSAIREYTAELRRIAQHHLSKYEDTGEKQEWQRNGCLQTAITLIGAYGEKEDLELLRRFVDHSSCARAAIEAIKALQMKPPRKT